VIFSLIFALFSCKPPKKAPQTQEQTFGATPVKIAKVTKRKISEKIFQTGTIEAWQKITIMPDVGGKIAKIYVDAGDRVVKGQVLAELDTEAIRLQLKQAEAGLAVAEAAFKDAGRNKERMERLVNENAVSEQQFEQVKLAHEAAQAQLAQAQAAVNLARHSLNVSIMKAPFSGVIASKNAEVGDVINPLMGGFGGPSGVLTLVDFSKVKAMVDFSQDGILRVQKGQTVILKTSSFPDREFRGTVTLVNLAADPQSKKFKVEVTADNPDLALRPGTFGEIIFELSSHEDALAVPQKAVIENKYVFLAQGTKALKKEVRLGLQNTGDVEIVEGVSEGDAVIVEGNYGLEDGAAIEIVEEVIK
jgi:RND family efflux transporter MFP subunit